ncbi:MAG: putative MarR-family transcriptional regulator [Glaciihabitans sp.]|nr:putative MarR-family transcriptional regulator [Glaciihabitans sp.]
MKVTPARSAGRRSPTAHDLKVWREFIETGEHLRSLIGSRLQVDSELSSGDYAVLLALAEANGKRMRSSELANHIEWERSRLSHHLGRMESRGLISREKCATDSRGADVVLTERGSSLFRRASAPHLKAVQELFIDAFTPELLTKVDEVTAALRGHLASLSAIEGG